MLKFCTQFQNPIDRFMPFVVIYDARNIACSKIAVTKYSITRRNRSRKDS